MLDKIKGHDLKKFDGQDLKDPRAKIELEVMTLMGG
jgi:hypothetical protein